MSGHDCNSGTRTCNCNKKKGAVIGNDDNTKIEKECINIVDETKLDIRDIVGVGHSVDTNSVGYCYTFRQKEKKYFKLKKQHTK